jgi:hypothetical protein
MRPCSRQPPRGNQDLSRGQDAPTPAWARAALDDHRGEGRGRLAVLCRRTAGSALAKLDDPFAQLTGPLASTTRLDFEVADSTRLTPHMQRLMLTAPQLDGFGYLPGQDVMLLVAAEGNRPVRRATRSCSSTRPRGC